MLKRASRFTSSRTNSASSARTSICSSGAWMRLRAISTRPRRRSMTCPKRASASPTVLPRLSALNWSICRKPRKTSCCPTIPTLRIDSTMKLIHAMAGFAAAALATSALAFTYPDTKKVDIVDTYDGIKVSDPYRWLEDDNASDTKAWVEAQNKVTFDYLAAIPARDKIKARLTVLFNHERYGLPFREGGRYFWSKNDGLQPQSVLYTARLLDAEPKVLLDPNGWSKDGTMALAGYAVSDNGKYVAYGVSSGGSDWREWKVRNIENNVDLPDVIKWVKFSGAVW